MASSRAATVSGDPVREQHASSVAITDCSSGGSTSPERKESMAVRVAQRNLSEAREALDRLEIHLDHLRTCHRDLTGVLARAASDRCRLRRVLLSLLHVEHADADVPHRKPHREPSMHKAADANTATSEALSRDHTLYSSSSSSSSSSTFSLSSLPSSSSSSSTFSPSSPWLTQNEERTDRALAASLNAALRSARTFDAALTVSSSNGGHSPHTSTHALPSSWSKSVSSSSSRSGRSSRTARRQEHNLVRRSNSLSTSSSSPYARCSAGHTGVGVLAGRGELELVNVCIPLAQCPH
jgi:hypothetical protein